MSAIGPKQTYAAALQMSAFVSKDMGEILVDRLDKRPRRIHGTTAIDINIGGIPSTW